MSMSASGLTKDVIKKDYPGVYESYLLQSSLPDAKYAEKELFWKNHDITCFQRWAVPYFVEREKEKKKPCLRLNYPFDGKCTDCVEKRCRYDRVCFMCGLEGHGAFQVHNSGKLNGKYKCNKHRAFDDQLDALLVKYDVSVEEIGDLFFNPPSAEVSSKASASSEKKEEVKEEKKVSVASSSSSSSNSSSGGGSAASTSTVPTIAAKVAGSIASSKTASTSSSSATASSNNPSNSSSTAPKSSDSSSSKIESSTSPSSISSNSSNNSTNAAATAPSAASRASPAVANTTASSATISNSSYSSSTSSSSSSAQGGGAMSTLSYPSSPPHPSHSSAASPDNSTSSPPQLKSNNNNLFSNNNSSNNVEIAPQIPMSIGASMGSIQGQMPSIGGSFGGNFNGGVGVNSNSSIGINNSIGSMSSTIDDGLGIRGNASRPLPMFGENTGFNNSYSGFGNLNFDNSSIFDSGSSSSASLYSQLGLNSNSQLGGLGSSSNIGNSFMSQNSIGSLVGGGGVGVGGNNGLVSSGPLFSSLSLGAPDSLLSHSPIVVGSMTNASVSPLQATLHHVSTSIVNYPVPDCEEFCTSSASLQVLFSNSNFLRQTGNGLLYRGLLSSSRGQEDVAVFVIKKSAQQISDKALFKSEIGHWRQLGNRNGHNVARVFQKSIVDINYPINSSEEYNIITSEYSEMGYLDGYLANYVSKRPQGIPLIDIQAYTLQLIEGLSRIHESNICHLNIRPSSILVSSGERYQTRLSSSKLCLKFTNFKMSSVLYKEYPSNEFWTDPESVGLVGYNVNSPQYDVFSLGCLLFYLVSDGKCLYESHAQAVEAHRDNALRQQIIKRYNLHSHKSYMLFDLIENMTRPLALKTSPRISLDLARFHPFLWNSSTRLSVLLELALESAKSNIEKTSQSEFFVQLDDIGKKLIFVEKWTSQMDPALVACVQPQSLVTDYKHSTRGLLQAIHNLYKSEGLLQSSVYPNLNKSQLTIEFINRITEHNFPKLLVLLFNLVSHYGYWKFENEELKHYWK